MGLADIALEAGRQDRSGTPAADIIEFIESSWGLNISLFPVQRVILKAYYGLPLDDTIQDVVVSDWRRQKFEHLTEAGYLRKLYDEGRSNIREVLPGQHKTELVLSIGRRSGKCKSADSLVVTSQGLLELREIGDTEGPEVQPIRIGVVQEKGRRADSAYFYCNGVHETRRLRTSAGFVDESTPNHRLKVLDPDGVVRWRYVQDIQVGDHIAINRSTNLWPLKEVLVPSIPGWELPPTVTEDFGLLLGYLTGDGTWGNASYLELTGLLEQVQRFSEISSKVLGHPGRMFLDSCSERAWHWRFDQKGVGVRGIGRSVRDVFHKLGFRLDVTTRTKRVPEAIRRSPRRVVAAFLRGLFETDGTISKAGAVSFSTASSQLAREVQALLLNMGVVASIQVKPNSTYKLDYYNVVIRGCRSRAAFHQVVGFDSHRKQSRLQQIVESQAVRQDNKSNSESIPYQRDWCRRLLESVPKVAPRPGQKQEWSRSALREVLGNTIKPLASDEMTYPRLAEVLPVARQFGADSEVIAHFEHLMALDYFFDPVVEVERGHCPTFDLNVPDGESFVANGMTNHNTFVCACVMAYEVYKLIIKDNPQGYYGIPKTNVIQLISVATDKDQAGLLYNEASGHFSQCFAAETEVITDQGVKPIGSLAGQSAVVLTRNGSWVEAPFRSFGKQQLYKLVLRRQGIQKVLYTTAGHRWFARDHRSRNRGKGFCEFKTTELRPGKHRLQVTFGRSYKNRVQPSPFGVAHGFTFGDGTTQNNRNAASCCLYGEKDQALLPYFAGCPQLDVSVEGDDTPSFYSTGSRRLQRKVPGIQIGALPNFFKSKPPITENKAYLLGWAMGYFAADGSVSSGHVRLSSADRGNLEFFRDVCVLLGIGAYDIRSETRVSNITQRPHTLYTMCIMRHTLDESFFVLDAHRRSFLSSGGDKVRRQAFLWQVESVEATDRIEEVFCATVPDHGDFVLEGNLATGNCGFYKPYTANNTMSYAKFQSPEDIKRFGRYVDDPSAKATIKVSFKSCVAKGLRGAGNIVVILDELAHFNDVGQSDALKIYRAVKPSLAAFSPKDPQDPRKPVGPVEGRILSISSPLGRQGFFYRKFRQGFSGGLESQNMLCIQAPTWEVNPTVEATFLAEEYATDPDSFFTEFGADFSDRTRGWLQPEDLLACVQPNLRPSVKAPVRAPHFLGLDISSGLVEGDYCAAAIGHITPAEQIELDIIERIRAGEGDYKGYERLTFEQIAKWLYGLSRRFYLESGLFDQWAGQPFEAELHKVGLVQVKSEFFTKQLTSQVFQNFKTLMFEKKLILFDWPRGEGPNDHSEHIEELLELQQEVHSKYLVTVAAPKAPGKYDDYSDALVRMVWEATKHMSNRKYIAGTSRQFPGQGKVSSGALAKAMAKARQMSALGGSSPDRQRSLTRRGSVRGRRR